MDFVWGILMIDEYRDIRLPYMTNRIWTWATKKDFCIPTVFKIGYQNMSKQFHGRQAKLCVSLWVMGYGWWGPSKTHGLLKVIWLIFPLEHQSFGWFFLGGVFFNIFLRTPWANQRKLVVANGSSRKICGSEHGTIDSIHGSKRAVFISRICLREMVAAMPPYMNI